MPAAYIYQSRMRQGRPGHPSYPSQPSTYTGSWSKQPPLQPSPQPPQFSMSFPSSPQPLIPGDIYWQPSQPQFDPQYPYPPGGLHPLPGYTTTTSHFSSLPSQPQPQPQPRTKFSSFTSTTQRPGQPGWRT